MGNLVIDILCNDGSPLGVTCESIYGKDSHQVGVGGAELALLTMCEAWHEAGHKVTLYNDPRNVDGSCFRQKYIHQFKSNQDRDVLIIFRSPNKRAENAKGLKVWWSTDQHTVGDFKDFGSKVDKIVLISDFHAEHFKNTYELDDTIVIDLPVRLYDYDKEIEKIPYRFIFSSIPDRGLFQLAQIWDKLQGRLPEEASLVITSDYRLWGVGAPMNEKYKMMFISKPGVEFIGAVPRERLIEEQLKADGHLFPNIYDELFCVAVAESQVAGAYPITSDVGALETTNMGAMLEGHPEKDRGWLDKYVEFVLDEIEDREELIEKQEKVRKLARERFDPKRIVREWDEKVFNL